MEKVGGGGQKGNDRVASHDDLPIHLKIQGHSVILLAFFKLL